jgi:hypothetical protein
MIDFIEEKLENRLIQYLLLASITVLAAVLRIYKLGEWSFWYDEIFTLRDVSRIFELSATNQQVSRWLIFGAVNFLGTNEFNTRLVPALVGILSVPILYFPTRKLTNIPTALMFGLFLAISPWHLYWSQNARFYTTLLLFYTLGLFLIHFAFEEDKPWYLVFALFFFGLAVMEREFAAMLVPVVAVYLLGIWLLPFEKPSGFRARNILIVLIPTLLMVAVGSYRYIANPGAWYQGFGWINNNPIWILSGITFYIGVPFICVGLVTAVYFLLKKDRGIFILAVAAILPGLVIILLSMIQYTANRYVFVSLTSWLILAAFGVWELFKLNRDRAWILVSGILLILLLFPMGENVLYYRYQNGNRDDWKGAFELVSRLKEPDDLVVVTEKRMVDYYLDEDVGVNFNDLDYETLAESDLRYWFIEDNNLGEKNPEILAWVAENSDLIADMDVDVRARKFKMRVYLFDPSEQ